MRHEVLLRLAIEGDLRFISHRDTVRMLERALVRSGLPLAYSKGFNPHIKLSLPLPRPVGIATEDDLVVLQLTEDCTPAEIESRLKPQMPAGARILEVVPLTAGSKPRLTSVSYELELEPEVAVDVPQAVDRFLESEAVVIEKRDRQGRPKGRLDLRPLVEDLRIQNNALLMITKFQDNRTAAPKDLITALSLPWDRLRHRIRRKKIGYQ